MKQIYLFILGMLCVLGSLSAQDDELQIEHRQERDSFVAPSFANMQDYLFMQQVETRSLWKVPLIGSNSSTGFGFAALHFNYGDFPPSNFFVEYERKLNDYFSINTGLVLSGSLGYDDFTLDQIGLNLEPRWYLGMRRKIAEGKSANNLSGNYLGLQLSAFRDRANGNFFPGDNGVAALLNFGVQRRVLRRGYFSFRAGLGAGYSENVVVDGKVNEQGFITELEYDDRWRAVFQAEVTYGVAFGKGRPEEGRLCDVLMCFQEEQQLFKINVANLINGLSRYGYSGRLSVAFEQKLGASAFSVQLDITGNYAYSNGIFNTLHYAFLDIGFEPRYYYNLKKRIAQGKSGNNLFANYFTLRTSYVNTHERWSPKTVSEPFEYRDGYVLLTPAWGFQRRIFKKGYVGYQFGIGYGRNVRKNSESSSFIFDFRSDFRFGLAF
jgi:hypothetical protein